jgi:hypothetical protein
MPITRSQSRKLAELAEERITDPETFAEDTIAKPDTFTEPYTFVEQDILKKQLENLIKPVEHEDIEAQFCRQMQIYYSCIDNATTMIEKTVPLIYLLEHINLNLNKLSSCDIRACLRFVITTQNKLPIFKRFCQWVNHQELRERLEKTIEKTSRIVSWYIYNCTIAELPANISKYEYETACAKAKEYLDPIILCKCKPTQNM